MDLVTLDPLTSTYETGPELPNSRVRYRQISTCVRRKTSEQQSQTATSVQKTIVLAPRCISPVRLREIVSNRIDHSIKFASRILFRFDKIAWPAFYRQLSRWLDRSTVNMRRVWHSHDRPTMNSMSHYASTRKRHAFDLYEYDYRVRPRTTMTHTGDCVTKLLRAGE